MRILFVGHTSSFRLILDSFENKPHMQIKLYFKVIKIKKKALFPNFRL